MPPYRMSLFPRTVIPAIMREHGLYSSACPEGSSEAARASGTFSGGSSPLAWFSSSFSPSFPPPPPPPPPPPSSLASST
eukprot:scaffold878_cov271-Pinguiococcus_pyrenoidosus.AAC.12